MSGLPRTPSFQLTGRRALVTGASSGIGQACAVAMAEAGASVTLAARSLDKLQQTRQAFEAQGWQASVQTLDVADIDAVQDFIQSQPPFDILINSAGLARHGPALETSRSDFDAVNDINVRGAYFLTQAVAKQLVAAQKTGSLINISSQMAKVGGVDRAVYCATKHAVDGFTKSMAMEFGQYGIRVNSICPTFIRTALTKSTFDNPDRVKWIEEKIKLGRVGEVEDIMGAAVFLASDASSLITGTALMIDGGWTIG